MMNPGAGGCSGRASHAQILPSPFLVRGRMKRRQGGRRSGLHRRYNPACSLVPLEPVDYLVIGHLTEDVTPGLALEGRCIRCLTPGHLAASRNRHFRGEHLSALQGIPVLKVPADAQHDVREPPHGMRARKQVLRQQASDITLGEPAGCLAQGADRAPGAGGAGAGPGGGGGLSGFHAGHHAAGLDAGLGRRRDMSRPAPGAQRLRCFPGPGPW